MEMDKRKRHEKIMLIVASNLAQYMDDDLPNHARSEFEIIVAQNSTKPVMLGHLTSKYYDMIRPRKAKEILNIHERFINVPIFNARTRAITAQIEQMLDALTPHRKDKGEEG
jgi:hypothetical protein